MISRPSAHTPIVSNSHVSSVPVVSSSFDHTSYSTDNVAASSNPKFLDILSTLSHLN